MIANLFASRVRGGEKKKPPQAIKTSGGVNSELLLQVTNDLMPVGASVATAGYMDPIVFAVGGFKNQLIEVSISL